MSIELSMLAPHVPSICHEDQVPDFQQGIVDGLKEVSKEIAQINPDVIVLVSCHWPSTFAHYVDCNPVHKGLLTATEAPDLIKDVPYNYPGDEELANQFVQAGKDAGLPVEGYMTNILSGIMVRLFLYVILFQMKIFLSSIYL